MEKHLASVSEDAVKLKLLPMTVYMLKVPVQSWSTPCPRRALPSTSPP